MGDDLIDITAMLVAGFSFVPANAVEQVKVIADYACTRHGVAVKQ